MATGYIRQSSANIQSGLPIQSADINNELNQVQSAMDITTGHDHSGSAAGTGSKISLTASVTATLPVANGGTGTTTSTGSGSVVLSAGPTLTGRLTTGTLTATSQQNVFGSAAGSKTSPTNANTNILLYNAASTNYAGIGAHTDGAIYLVTGTSAPATRMVIDPVGNVQLNKYLAGALSSDASGNLTSGILSVANGGTGTNTLTTANLSDYTTTSSWTPADASGAALALTFTDARYVRIGKLVMVSAAITYPVTGSAATAIISGLPVSSFAGTDKVGGGSCSSTSSLPTPQPVFLGIAANSAVMTVEGNGGVNLANSGLSGGTIRFTIMYISA